MPVPRTVIFLVKEKDDIFLKIFHNPSTHQPPEIYFSKLEMLVGDTFFLLKIRRQCFFRIFNKLHNSCFFLVQMWDVGL